MTTWHTVRVTYYADQDALVGDAVATLFGRVRRSVTDAYFVRHWRQGPHLRLNFRCTEAVFRDVVLVEANRVIGDHLRRHPSRAVIDVMPTLALHRRLAVEEHERGALEPWLPDNTIHPAAYDDRRHVLDAGERRMVEEFFIRTNDLAFDMTRTIMAGRSRAQLAFDLMVTTAHGLSGAGIQRGFVSLRSHAESFLTYTPEGEHLRGKWAWHYRDQEPSLRRRLRAVLSTLDNDDDAVPFVHDWLRELSALKVAATRMISAGQLALSVPSDTRSDRGVLAPASSHDAPYHDWMVQTRASRTSVETAEWFLAYRWVLNCTYLQLTRLGLAPANRYLLCSWVANAVEQEFGIDAFAVAKRVLRDAQQDPAPEPEGT